MSPAFFPIEAIGNLWEILCCGATLMTAAVAWLLAPR